MKFDKFETVIFRKHGHSYHDYTIRYMFLKISHLYCKFLFIDHLEKIKNFHYNYKPAILNPIRACFDF